MRGRDRSADPRDPTRCGGRDTAGRKHSKPVVREPGTAVDVRHCDSQPAVSSLPIVLPLVETLVVTEVKRGRVPGSSIRFVAGVGSLSLRSGLERHPVERFERRTTVLAGRSFGPSTRVRGRVRRFVHTPSRGRTHKNPPGAALRHTPLSATHRQSPSTALVPTDRMASASGSAAAIPSAEQLETGDPGSPRGRVIFDGRDSRSLPTGGSHSDQFYISEYD